ncbi:hypothetical protein MMC13_002773 [Lambiella insularis]|nr:hypothetical protein [Lambiella insularis]
MPQLTHKGWLPREALALPLYLLTRFARNGEFALQHARALRWLKICLYLGIARWGNGFLNQRALNNWEIDSWDWEKELVVITGGSDGFGALLVQLFATKNAKVVILDIQPPTFELPNARIHYLPVDLSSSTAITEVSASLKAEHGNPTILILNAGISNRGLPILSTPDVLLSRIFAVNTLSHFRLAREFLPAMAASNHGALVTVSSLAAYVTISGLVDYCSTKASAVAFHEGVTAELRHRYNAPKVRTICVCPNFAKTKLSDGFLNDSKFLSPTLEAETVAEGIFERVVKGQSGFLVLPKTHAWLAMTIRSFPWWYQLGLQRKTKEMMRGLGEKEVERLERKERKEREKEEESDKGF